jgi:signal peptidase I
LQKYLGYGSGPTFSRGDIIGFAHPNHPYHISCKRIIGLPGDKVQRYGQYVHLFIEQDPEHLGIMWPSNTNDDNNNNNDPYNWIDRECSWDTNKGKLLDNTNKTLNLKEVYRTIQIPDGYVWIEADCPALGIDSRQLGPIPIEWIQGKVISKIWPFWHPSDNSLLTKKDKRPHPIPLDDETLEQYNVYRIQQPPQQQQIVAPTESS